MSDEHSTPASGRPPRQSRSGLTSTGARKAASKSNRSRAREFALQALYQHLVGGNDVEAIDRFTRDLSGFHKADSVHYDALLRGCINSQVDLDALIAPKLDRTMAEISPIEHASMWIGVYEFQHCPDVPWRVVLNECIELAKEFGGTDGHKYVNAVLNGLAPTLRAAEVEHDRAAKGSAPAQPAATKAGTATDAAADAATDAAADDAADQAAG
ncbi:MAG: transcription antitermination factor NusB [Delftia acidovorans]|jgi:N utilization substance protein B|nr:transcription antitermination factor NusB [Delftia acidovorans]